MQFNIVYPRPAASNTGLGDICLDPPRLECLFCFSKVIVRAIPGSSFRILEYMS